MEGTAVRLPWPHRDGDADDAPPPAAVPSPESTGRLADRLHREVEDLRDGLTDDLLLALLLLGEDEGEEAVGLLDLGSDRLHRFQDRVEGAVADAAVEREAEHVLAAAGADGTGPGSGAGRGSGNRGTARRIRALASVAAAALTAIVALVSVEPSDPELVAASASSPAAATSSSDADLPDVAAVPGTRGSTDGAETGEPVSPSTVTPDGRLEALRAIDDEDDVLARLGNEPRRSIVAALFAADRLADDVVAGVDDVLSSEPVDAVTEAASEVELPADRPSPEPEPTTDESPSEAPTTDPAADGSTAEDPDDEATEETSSDGSDGTTDDGASEDGEPDDDGSSSEDPDGRDGWFPSGTDGATATDGSGLL